MNLASTAYFTVSGLTSQNGPTSNVTLETKQAQDKI